MEDIPAEAEHPDAADDCPECRLDRGVDTRSLLEWLASDPRSGLRLVEPGVYMIDKLSTSEQLEDESPF